MTTSLFSPPPKQDSPTYPSELLQHPAAKQARFLPLSSLSLTTGFLFYTETLFEWAHSDGIELNPPESCTSLHLTPPLRRGLRLWWKYLPQWLSEHAYSSCSFKLQAYSSLTTSQVGLRVSHCDLRKNSEESLSLKKQISSLHSFVAYLKKLTPDAPLSRLDLFTSQEVHEVHGSQPISSSFLGLTREFPPLIGFPSIPAYSIKLYQRLITLAGPGSSLTAHILGDEESTLSLLLAQAGYKLSLGASSTSLLKHQEELFTKQGLAENLSGVYSLEWPSSQSNLWVLLTLQQPPPHLPGTLSSELTTLAPAHRPKTFLCALTCSLQEEASWKPFLEAYTKTPYTLRQVEGFVHPPLSSSSPHSCTLIMVFTPQS